MLHFSLWKKLVIWGLCLFGVALAMPNAFYSTVERHNDAVTALADPDIPETPELIADRDAWPSYLPSDVVNLGLDLRGGVQLLVQVKVEDVYRDRLDAMWSEVRDILREDRDTIGTVRNVTEEGAELRVRIGNAEAMSQAVAAVQTLSRPVVSLTGAGSRDFEVTSEGDELIMTLSDAEKVATDDRTMLQSLEIIRNRIDAYGTREPVIQRQGADRILIQVPGLGSAEELLEIIGKTAKLTFNTVVGRTDDPDTIAGVGNFLVPDIEVGGGYYILERVAVVGGEQLKDARPDFDRDGAPAVSFRFDPTGARIFGAYTATHIGQPFAIVLDNEVISAPTIQSHISGGSGIITGNFTLEESTRLAILLRAGSLPAKVIPLEQRTTGPELGADSIQAGKVAAIVAFVGVLVFMTLSYGLFGIFANVALVLNVAILFGLLSTIGATLTLPGIAGIVLTLGMAVDANVLIFERIREELKSGKGPALAIEQGYEKAFSAIIDANVTTLIAAVILFAMGSGPVKGFAVTLGLGIVTSVFTAIWVTRLIVSIWLKMRNPKTIEV